MNGSSFISLEDALKIQQLLCDIDKRINRVTVKARNNEEDDRVGMYSISCHVDSMLLIIIFSHFFKKNL